MLKTQTKFNSLVQKYSKIYLIVSPPRCSSTALARVFWEQPTIGQYCHEPFEVRYYENKTLDAVLQKLNDPLDLTDIKVNPVLVPFANSLLIKEMPYQVGEHFPLLASLVTKPIIFLIRDPRLNISSRMTKKIEGGDNPEYPFIESGWDLLFKQIQWCESEGIPYSIADATDFRNFPMTVLKKLFNRLGLPFSQAMLSWKAQAEVRIDNLNGSHRHLYHRILNSTGLLPANERIPRLEDFSEENGFREHVEHCLELYKNLRNNPARITP